jgi:hypothetical protein
LQGDQLTDRGVPATFNMNVKDSLREEVLREPPGTRRAELELFLRDAWICDDDWGYSDVDDSLLPLTLFLYLIVDGASFFQRHVSRHFNQVEELI